MVGDLKKFGLPNVKNIKIETLKPGYGEIVCQLIDELVNIELYRREFEFRPPQFPEEQQSHDSDQVSGSEDVQADFQGHNEVINGIEIHTHSLLSPTHNMSSKKTKVAGKAEETKINFFFAN